VIGGHLVKDTEQSNLAKVRIAVVSILMVANAACSGQPHLPA